MRFFSVASVALIAAAGVSAIVIPGRHVRVARLEKPDTYYEGYLEPYITYHTRYLAIDCDAQHNTAFFDKCCHPMLATETLEKNRAPECNPANRPASTSSTASPTASHALTGGDDDDCEDDEPTATAPTSPPKSTDGDEPTTTAKPTSTQKPVTTKHSTTVQSTTPATTEHPATTSKVTTSTHTTHASTPTTKAAQPTSDPNPPAEGQFTGGHATFFYQGGQAGACGEVNPDTAFVAALQTNRYGSLNAQSKNCGRKIRLTNTKNNKSVDVVVADACPTCPRTNDLDLSVAAFHQIATEEEGEVPITWSFLD